MRPFPETSPGPGLAVRPTELRDIPSLYHVRASTRQNPVSRDQLLEWGITPESIAEGFETGEFQGMVCESGEAVVGFCTGNTRTGEVLVLAVLPEFENRKVGLTLLEGVVAELRRSNVPSIWLGCSPNPESRSYGFYRANGWGETGQKTETGDDILVLLP